jgi:hypothetical protein
MAHNAVELQKQYNLTTDNSLLLNRLFYNNVIAHGIRVNFIAIDDETTLLHNAEYLKKDTRKSLKKDLKNLINLLKAFHTPPTDIEQLNSFIQSDEVVVTNTYRNIVNGAYKALVDENNTYVEFKYYKEPVIRIYNVLNKNMFKSYHIEQRLQEAHDAIKSNLI